MVDYPLGSDPEATNANPQVPWTPEQWDRVRQVVQEEATRARVAADVLPLYGPLAAETDFVRTNLISQGAMDGLGKGAEEKLEIDDISTMKLWVLQVKLFFRGAQMADPELTSVLAMFRRAANVLARLEDTIIFNGIPKHDQLTKKLRALPPVWEILGRNKSSDHWMPGLLPDSPTSEDGTTIPDNRYDPKPEATPSPPLRNSQLREWALYETKNKPEDLGNELVGVISKAIGNIEEKGFYGPYAIVLGQNLFQAVQTPNDVSLVLPQDRIIPFLGSGGSLLRSTTIPDDQGVILALGGEPVELVVATDISVNFLQVTTDPAYVFRLSEKLVLRIKNPGAIRGLKPAQANPSS